ncbi:MAG: hypothetical protein HRT82_16010 [Henriciella sp.]|nr:hypothetical protein [Henriciella sp.]
MSRLTLRYTLDGSDRAREFSRPHAKLLEVRKIEIVRVSAREIPSQLDLQLADLARVDGVGLTNTVSENDTVLATLSRRERLILCKADRPRSLYNDVIEIVEGCALVTDASHQFVIIDLSGRAATEILSSLTPLSFESSIFTIGDCLRTVFADTNVLVIRSEDEANYRLIFEQTLAGYAWRLLEDAAKNV